MASATTLEKIAKTLKKMAARQEELLERIERLENQSKGVPASEAITFLDQFRAGEALGEASLGAWIAVCRDRCLRGGLRTVQMREGMHAQLLEQRIKELGGTPNAEIPQPIFDAAMAQSASREKSDAEKVADFVARFPDIDEALAPIDEMVAKLDEDPETQSLLRTICQDERSTLEFFAESCRAMNG